MDPKPRSRVCSFERVGLIEPHTLNKLWRPFWTQMMVYIAHTKIFHNYHRKFDVRSFVSFFRQVASYANRKHETTRHLQLNFTFIEVEVITIFIIAILFETLPKTLKILMENLRSIFAVLHQKDLKE